MSEPERLKSYDRDLKITSLGKLHKKLSEEVRQLEGEMDFLKCEANNRQVWVKHKLEKDKEALTRIQSMEGNAEKDLKAMTERLETANEEARRLKEKLEKKEAEGELTRN